MSSLDILKSIYKPYRYTLNNHVTIVDSSSGKFVIKKQNKDLFTLFNYLHNRGFDSFPEIKHNYRNEENVFEYIEEDAIPEEQKLEEMAALLASLHNKTVYYKKASLDGFKEIYDAVHSNISYLSSYYESLYLNICKEEFVSPSKYLFARNYYKVRQSLAFCKEEIDAWYNLVKDEEKARVAVVHNNLALEHFIYNQQKSALISWDQYKIDTPIIDFVHLYQKEYLNHDFATFLEKYFNHFEFLESEKKLLFILISLPMIFELSDNEFNNTKLVKENISYIYGTEKLIRPYYFKEEEK